MKIDGDLDPRVMQVAFVSLLEVLLEKKVITIEDLEVVSDSVLERYKKETEVLNENKA